MRHTVIPFGPQHPVLPEPIHLQLTIREERVVEVLPALGFVHRGLERLVEARDVPQMIQVVERVCGICSMIHAHCFCMGVEALLGIEAPPRAQVLRVLWSELYRVQSHLLWLGLFADCLGFESLFMQFWRIRERILDLGEATTGNRVIVSVNVIGGVRRDPDAAQLAWVAAEIDRIEEELRRLEPAVLDDPTVRRRTVGKGVLSRAQAWELGAVGPTARASGIAEDIRQTNYAAYGRLYFEPVVETDGDSHARLRVRYRETLASLDLVRRAIRILPAGEVRLKLKEPPAPRGEIVVRVEQPRGELLYYLKGSGEKRLDRVRIRTPTFANLPAMLAMLPGVSLSDVPVVTLSIDPCISCTER